MGSKGSAPAAPDYSALIPQQEAAYNRSFNRMLGASRVNSYTPFGSTTWTRPGDNVYNVPGPVSGPVNPAQPDDRKYAQAAGPAPDPMIWQEQGDGGSPVQVPNPAYADWLQQQQPGGTQAARNPTGLDIGDYGDPWTLTQSLSPEQQDLYNQDIRIRQGMGNIGEGMLGGMADLYGQPVDFASQLPDFRYIGPEAWRGPNYRTDMSSRDDAERAIFNRQMRYDLPLMERRRQQERDKLLAQGANAEDVRFGNRMGDVYDAENKYWADAVDRAVLGGGQEATAELARALSTAQAGFGAGMQGRQFMSGQQQNALNYALSQLGQQRADRATPLNELSAFRTGSQVQLPGAPAQFNTPNLQSTDPMGAAQNTYNAQLGQYNANQAASNNFMSGLFGLGGAAVGSQGFWPFATKALGIG